MSKERIEISKLHEFRWQVSLPPEMVERIVKIHRVIGATWGMKKSEFIDGFYYDMHPEREVLIWEHITKAFVEFITPRTLSPKQKTMALNLLAVGSSGSDLSKDLHKLVELGVTAEDANALVDCLHSAFQDFKDPLTHLS